MPNPPRPPLHPDHQAYFRFTPKARRDRDLNELFGLVEGTTIDALFNDREAAYLKAWLAQNAELRAWHPYSELFVMLEDVLADGVLTRAEQQDLCGACRLLTSTEYYDRATATVQRLHGILAGIVADGVITEVELDGLQRWLELHSPWLSGWPFMELTRLLERVLADGRIDPAEQEQLKAFFTQFAGLKPDEVGAPATAPPMEAPAAVDPAPPRSDGPTLHSVLALHPTLVFPGRTFCFTGASANYRRKDFRAIVECLDGRFVDSISARLDYLVLGTAGNPTWAYSCYGRKIESALELQRSGAGLLIVHEDDFHAAVEKLDRGG